MAIQAGNESVLVDLSCVKCALCLDIFEDPYRLPCSHMYCKKCLESLLSGADGKCPNCRQPFSPQRCQADRQMQQVLKMRSAVCEGCNKQIALNQLRRHSALCDKVAGIERRRVLQSSVPEATVIAPNRQTFVCPYCSAKNLDCQGLIKHCTDTHSDDRRPVVCPVCAAMPWGNPLQTSINFLQHLSLRHKFEYDTYVDYQQDDDAMLTAAIQASMMTQ